MASLVVVGIAALFVGTATFAVFRSTTANATNDVTAGTVQISDNDAGGAMLTLSSAGPGSSTLGCILVTYGGSLDADVRLYGSSSGGIAPHLTLTITRGIDATPTFPGCGSFQPDATNYIGQGAGVIYQGPLSSYPSTYAGGIVDAPGAAETWTTTESHVYRFSVTLGNDPGAQGTSGSATFEWEARNT